jgi:hypothetical protein
VAAKNEPAELLRDLVAQYRGLHAGKAPERIYVSLDIFGALQDQNTVTNTGNGFAFDGVAVEPKSGQSLPFLLRP